MSDRRRKVEPCDMPRHSPQHLEWRLRGVRPDAPAGWFLFDGLQIATIRAALAASSPVQVRP